MMNTMLHLSGELQLVPAVRIMQEWAARLDGKMYQQGDHYLSQFDATAPGGRCFCVLGVLAEVLVDFGFMIAVERPSFARCLTYSLIDASEMDCTASDASLPDVLDKVFSDRFGQPLSFDYVGGLHTGLNAMANLNDYEGVEFDEFAIIIREQFIPLMQPDLVTIH